MNVALRNSRPRVHLSECDLLRPRRNAHDPLLVDILFTEKVEGDPEVPPYVEALIKGPAQLGSSISSARETPL
jgi:hypothetical protein